MNLSRQEHARRGFLQLGLGALLGSRLHAAPGRRSGRQPSGQDVILPRHVTAGVVDAVQRGLEYLESVQSPDGSFTTTQDGGTYPIAMTGLAGMGLLASGSTSSRGPWADPITRTMRFLLKCSTQNGLLATPNQDSGRPMFGHGFSLLFLACLYGMENDPLVRAQLASVIREAISLTSRGQSKLGGWMYTPGGGDEGSVTITQMQALRACHNAGFVVPLDTVEMAKEYLEKCKTDEGGIRYSFNSHPTTQLPITSAAVATLYNAGAYESELAESCLAYVFKHMADLRSLDVPGAGGHTYYTHLYASQAFYQAGEKHWGNYFPRASKLLVKEQKGDGSWVGDGVGPVFGTSVALIILQMPFKLLPIYQR